MSDSEMNIFVKVIDQATSSLKTISNSIQDFGKGLMTNKEQLYNISKASRKFGVDITKFTTNSYQAGYSINKMGRAFDNAKFSFLGLGFTSMMVGRTFASLADENAKLYGFSERLFNFANPMLGKSLMDVNASFENMKMKVLDAAAPALISFFDLIQKGIKWFTDFDAKHDGLLSKIVMLTVVLAPAITFISMMAIGIANLGGVLALFTTGPLLALTLAIAAGVIAWKLDFFHFRDWSKDAFHAIGMIISGFVDLVTGVITGDWNKAWNGAKSVVFGVLDWIIAGLEAFINNASDMIKKLTLGAVDLGHYDIPSIEEYLAGITAEKVAVKQAAQMTALGAMYANKTASGGGEYVAGAMASQQTTYNIYTDSNLLQSYNTNNPYASAGQKLDQVLMSIQTS